MRGASRTRAARREGGTELSTTDTGTALAALDLLDYRRRVAEMYRQAREPGRPPAERRERFRRERDRLFGTHPQSPLSRAAQRAFAGLPYFAYDEGLRVVAEVEDAPGEPFEVRLAEDGVLRLRRVAKLHLELAGRSAVLALFARLGYGGGLFLPFSDATSGRSTYGGGRYLLDTVKGADLGSEGGGLVCDFNFAYHPSCAYDPRWDCPLAPPENRLALPVEAGERLPPRAPADGAGDRVSAT